MLMFPICVVEEMQMNSIDGGVLCSSMHNAHSLHPHCWPQFILPQSLSKQVGICSCEPHYGDSHLLPFSFLFYCNSCPANDHHRAQVLLSLSIFGQPFAFFISMLFTFWSKNSLRHSLGSPRKSVHERPRNSDGWQVKWSVFRAIWLKRQDP